MNVCLQHMLQSKCVVKSNCIDIVPSGYALTTAGTKYGNSTGMILFYGLVQIFSLLHFSRANTKLQIVYFRCILAFVAHQVYLFLNIHTQCVSKNVARKTTITTKQNCRTTEQDDWIVLMYKSRDLHICVLMCYVSFIWTFFFLFPTWLSVWECNTFEPIQWSMLLFISFFTTFENGHTSNGSKCWLHFDGICVIKSMFVRELQNTVAFLSTHRYINIHIYYTLYLHCFNSFDNLTGYKPQ